MKLTKYGHACVFVENNSSRIVIDPGSLTELPEDLSNIVAVVCTHMHGDHTDLSNIEKILAQSPHALVIAHPESLKTLDSVTYEKKPITSTEKITIGEFTLNLKVIDHAIIWKTSPCKNLTVAINDFYYYAGDSFELSDEQFEVVGIPLSAPWLKVADAIEFARAMNARRVMPTHNGLLNEIGHEFNENWLRVGLDDKPTEILLLKNGESFSA